MSTVIYLTTADSSPWTVPSDWNSSDNSIECIGAGGGGGYNGRSGGGGGAYSKLSNISLTGGETINFAVGAAGLGSDHPTNTHINGTDGGNTYFNGSALTSCSVGAEGGKQSVNSGNASGGLAANGTGDITYSGGNGGAPSGTTYSGGGGGGSAGPNGNGSAGAAGNDTNGAAGGDADASTVTAPSASATSGITGNSGTEFDSTHGCGTGGSSPSATSSSTGGTGGAYGGGGAGGSGGSTSPHANGGPGADGLIVITYTPATSTYIPSPISHVRQMIA